MVRKKGPLRSRGQKWPFSHRQVWHYAVGNVPYWGTSRVMWLPPSVEAEIFVFKSDPWNLMLYFSCLLKATCRCRFYCKRRVVLIRWYCTACAGNLVATACWYGLLWETTRGVSTTATCQFALSLAQSPQLWWLADGHKTGLGDSCFVVLSENLRAFGNRRFYVTSRLSQRYLLWSYLFMAYLKSLLLVQILNRRIRSE
jgi:hypothetical protein